MYEERGIGRVITQDEALKILDEAKEEIAEARALLT